MPLAGKDEEQLKDLQDWLVSYKPADLFAADGAPVHDILDLLPADHRKLGQLKETYDPTVQVDIPDWRKFAVHKGEQVSPMKRLGEFLDDVMLANPTSFRVFSPDELVSNKLDSVFNHTGRNFQWDQYSNNQGGRVIEIQSEHCCQGFMQGYTSTGRVGLFPSYESFLGIIQTMMAQFMKFSKMVIRTFTFLLQSLKSHYRPKTYHGGAI